MEKENAISFVNTISQLLSLIDGSNNRKQQVQLFHTDRGKEFQNKQIDEVLQTFGIQRSLSMKGCPYDNAVTEATYKIIKTEFVKQKHFHHLPSYKWNLQIM